MVLNVLTGVCRSIFTACTQKGKALRYHRMLKLEKSKSSKNKNNKIVSKNMECFVQSKVQPKNLTLRLQCDTACFLIRALWWSLLNYNLLYLLQLKFLMLLISFMLHDKFTVSLEVHIFHCQATAGSVLVPFQGIWPGLFHLSSEG